MIVEVEIPALGESITECTMGKWLQPDGAEVTADQPVCELETDKANVDLPAPAAGRLKHLKQQGDTLRIGEKVAQIDTEAAGEAAGATPAPEPEAKAKPKLKAEPVVAAASAPVAVTTSVAPPAPKKDVARPATLPAKIEASVAVEGVRKVPMTRIRKRIAERLVEVKRQTAMLTTFNEADMSAVMDLRARHKEEFERNHGVSLGLMSFFVRACALALKEFPVLNASIEGDNIVYHDSLHLSVAVSTERGLVVPVLRDAQFLTFAQIEKEIKRLAGAARDGKLTLSELSGGTFTITNGGVFGSLLSTPILNAPESGILGMHTIQKRPYVVKDEIVIRPLMYVALSYDHRIVDGRESVSFLVRVKQYLEDPMRMILQL